MSTQTDNIVIAGGGLAAIRTAQALREHKHTGGILLLSDESCLPYDRPPLSKNYLIGKATDDSIRLIPLEKLEDLNIEVRLSQCVTGVDRSARLIKLTNNRAVAYDRLIVATGARPVKMESLNKFSNVHVLRSALDARKLREAMLPGRHIGIIGAGFIGLEIASAAISIGCRVTVIEAAQTPLAAILGSELGRCIQRWHERQGVTFRCGARVENAIGTDYLDSLELTDGSSLEIDAVVVGIGQTANTEWLADSGLELNKGLVCDEFGQTSDPLVFGVGDAVCYRIGVDCQPNRHWTATTDQATRLAKFMTGEIEQEVYMDDHYFWSEQYGSRIQFAGKVLPSSRIVWIKGGPDEDKFVALCGSDEGVTAVFSLGSPRDFLVHSMALRSREKVALTSP